MPTGIRYDTKQELVNGVQSLAVGNDNVELAMNSIIETLWNRAEPTVIVSNDNYEMSRQIIGNDFTIRIIFKKTTNFTDIELLPPNLAIGMTLDDIRYICYGPNSDTINYKYNITTSFNKLITNATFALAGDAYVNQLHLYDNVGDVPTAGFNYTSIGGVGNYTIPIIKDTGFLFSGNVVSDAGFLVGLLEFVFKGSFVGKI